RHTRSKRDWSSDVCSSDLNREESEVVFKDKRLEVGFETLTAYENAKLSKEEQEREKAAIETYETKCSHVKQQLVQLQEQLEGQTFVDVEMIRTQLTQFKEAYEYAFSTWNKSSTIYEALKELRKSIQDEQEQVQQTEKELAT